ncbi:glycosyltransferase family 1 protein [Clostridium tyrobutyricum]|uniref:glycosyltransferase family 1 protein n=1 Tax=Clostridium tyrobutyricum TaxID=1519 RepID=UPI001C3DC32E|nr:glycosyltransferase family 1 protein [Clostridium tyrobutyricum]MBV4438484.1 glycosyltransferase family 1 protein [Clostridium tyrobutyricum]
MLKSHIKKLYKNYKLKTQYKYYLNFSKYIEFNKINQIIPNKIEKIYFIIPGMFKSSGGHTSILRLGTYLSGFGYEIYYISYIDQDLNEMRNNAYSNLNNYRGTILDKSHLNNLKADIIIATLWESVYYIKNLNGYKMYFVQDYEPYFYTYGEKFLLSQKTYELGLHMVTLGEWNKFMIEKYCNPIGKMDFIEFPYEKSEYKQVERDFLQYKNKKEINLAVYVKFDEKRAPFIIQIMLKNLESNLSDDGIKLNIYYFGANKNDKFLNGTNLGKLNTEQLFNLYKKCDFGMVASLTNISLVPYEMIATNLPIIEFKEGTFKYFFNEKSAILTSFDYKELYNKIKYYLENPIKIVTMQKTALNYLNNLSWQKSSQQFKKILETII